MGIFPARMITIAVIWGLFELVGMAYLFQFFRRFQLNVLDFSEISDFLMVVVREPATIALALLGIPLYWIYMKTTMPWWSRAQQRWPTLRGDPAKLTERQERYRRLVPYLQVMFMLVYAMLFMLLYSAWQASRVRAGDYPTVTIEYKHDAVAGGGAVTATLLGTTSRFCSSIDPRPGARRPFRSTPSLA